MTTLSINLKESLETPFLRGLIIFYYKKTCMIRKLKSGQYRIYSRKKDAKTNKRKNLGTFDSLDAAKKHERAIQYFKHG
jgi:hypothetical protein